jgi:hypothetical protein
MGAIKVKQAKNHVGQLSKLQTLLHIFMWCHFNAMFNQGKICDEYEY